MNSFNHYAYGAIGEWLYRVVAGIEVDPAEPGYQHILFQPQPGGGLTFVRAALDTHYGLVTSAWELTQTTMHLNISVPANTHASVHLPAKALDEVSENGKPLQVGNGIVAFRISGEAAVIEVGSGHYRFVTSGLNLAKAMAGVRHIAGRLDRYSSIRDLVENERSRAILEKQLGAEALQGPRMVWQFDSSLDELSRFAPQLLTPEKLDAIENELKQMA
jgi:hypothetical protein